jgi:fructose-bisphosphate aldolase class I
MSTNNIEEIASYIVSEGKGILAADESNPTCGKRFDSIGVESTENNRRDYREMLFRASGMKDNIGGVILFDETIRQNAKDGTSLLDLINSQGALPGIKVDKGLQSIGESDESLTIGLDGLDERLKEYESMGAKFTKWRAVIKIGEGMPTDECIDLNMKALADYAKLVQDNGMVPIVEPEVLMDGSHSIDDCYAATERSLQSLFNHLNKNNVNIKATLLKPNMVLSGSAATSQAGVEEVAQKTLDCLKANVPADLAGITFLSGGQSDIDATAHLDAMNKIGGFSWKLSFSFGRALQAPALKAWGGKPENAFISQDALSHRAEMNKLAALGKWDNGMEED